MAAGDGAAALADAARWFGVPLDDVARRAARRQPLRFPKGYLALARPGDPEDPIRRIGWPEREEIEPDPEAIPDPVGEQGRKLHRLVVRKHPDRALLLLTSRCHFYCRFCFRADGGADASLDEVRDAVAVLARERGIAEVILSGGDPLVLPDDFLQAVLHELAALPELSVVRLHTRAPVHDPSRITRRLVRTLTHAAPRPLWIVLHATHPRELTADFERAAGRFLDAGVPLLDQSVLLRGVNADPETLEQLFRGLYARRVKPLYLHHPDRVAGAARFRLRIDEGLAIYRDLRRRLSGAALPAYVVDLPDGSGKVPVETLIHAGERLHRAPRPDGSFALYHDIA